MRRKGPYTRAEIQKRYRQRQRRLHPDPKTLRKQRQRDQRERALAEPTIAASQRLGSKLYGVLYVDPPWNFLVWGHETGMDRHVANHYPVMSPDQLFALPLPAAKDCVLYLWVPFNQLGNAVDVIRAWGFILKTGHGNGWASGGVGWGKPDLGTGYDVRENLELLLIATRGNPVMPAMGSNFPSLIITERGEPSEKPDIFAEIIARLWPNTPKLEMFARKTRPEWDQLGERDRADRVGGP
jgi:N6-adenosine-specific RNA methylase IME4